MVLVVRNLLARRGGFDLGVAEWSAAGGEFSAVLGANGAGKSTLFGVLGGDLDYRGQALLHNRELAAWPRAARARHLGVLPQQTQLSFAFTAAEVVALGLTPLTLGWRDGQRRVREVMKLTDTLHLAARAYPKLSGGERQRVSLARVLVQLSQADTTPLLLLDEPTSAQDLGHQHALLGLARNLAHAQGYAVVAILHDLNQALTYADRCAVLVDGAIAAEGAPAEVLLPDQVERIWGYRPQQVYRGTHCALI